MSSDIHDYQKRLEGALRSVERSEKISDQDKELITKFNTVLRIQRILSASSFFTFFLHRLTTLLQNSPSLLLGASLRNRFWKGE